MQLLEENLILSASDLTNYLACEHLTQLELSAICRECDCPEGTLPGVEVLTKRGIDHEEQYLESLRSNG